MSFAEIDSVTSMLLILVAALVVMIVATTLFCRVVPKLILRVMRTEQAERQYLDLLRDGYQRRNQINELQETYDQLGDQQKRLESELRVLRRKLADLNSQVPCFVHEVGEPRAGLTRFVSRLTIDGATPQLRPTSENYNPMWHHTNVAEVWAGSRDEARQTLDLAYPEKLGYQKQFVENSAQPAEEPSR